MTTTTTSTTPPPPPQQQPSLPQPKQCKVVNRDRLATVNVQDILFLVFNWKFFVGLLRGGDGNAQATFFSFENFTWAVAQRPRQRASKIFGREFSCGLLRDGDGNAQVRFFCSEIFTWAVARPRRQRASKIFPVENCRLDHRAATTATRK